MLALASSAWSESAEQAITNANRWLVYASLFAALLLLLRTDRLCLLLLAVATGSVLVLAGYLLATMLIGDGADLFVGLRLSEPLGYINGEAGFLLLGIWPLVALAERIEKPTRAGLAVASARCARPR